MEREHLLKAHDLVDHLRRPARKQLLYSHGFTSTGDHSINCIRPRRVLHLIVCMSFYSFSVVSLVITSILYSVMPIPT